MSYVPKQLIAMIRAAVAVNDDSTGSISISFDDHNGYNVVVQRTMDDIKVLKQKLAAIELSSVGSELLLPESDRAGSAPLEDYLNSWLGHYNESSQITEALVEFMEDTPGQSVVTQLQFNVLREKVCRILLFPLFIQ